MNNAILDKITDQARNIMTTVSEEIERSPRNSSIRSWVYQRLHHESYFSHWSIKAKAAGLVPEYLTKQCNLKNLPIEGHLQGEIQVSGRLMIYSYLIVGGFFNWLSVYHRSAVCCLIILWANTRNGNKNETVISTFQATTDIIVWTFFADGI